jgi:endonuclease/exonuclease/phosphatase family metal-dependent hydrolase
MRRLSLCVLVGLGAFVAACGGDDGADYSRTALPAATGAVRTNTMTVGGDSTPVPTEFRVAYINLMSPIALDNTNSIASDTYDQRLAVVIDQLKAFKPDLVGFSEATNTKAHGNAVATLAKELKMEQQTVRDNPWFPNSTQAANDEIAKQSGFEEFDVILTRSTFPILNADRTWLNPRTSETEARAALHVVVKAPGAMARIDVYLTHLTSGGDKVRSAQAASVLTFIQNTRGPGPLLLMGDLSDTSDSGAYKAFIDAKLKDLGLVANLPTCCREVVSGEQPPLTSRTDFFLVDRWAALAPALWGEMPATQADGTPLYASDHNGLTVVFPLSTAAVAP